MPIECDSVIEYKIDNEHSRSQNLVSRLRRSNRPRSKPHRLRHGGHGMSNDIKKGHYQNENGPVGKDVLLRFAISYGVDEAIERFASNLNDAQFLKQFKQENDSETHNALLNAIVEMDRTKNQNKPILN